MCGIFGIIKAKGPAYDAEKRAEWSRLVGSLAVLSTSRGMDSTGFMRVGADGAVAIDKDAVPAWEFLARPDWEAVSEPTDGTFATIGHTRMATHGAVTKANAHPFVFSAENGDVTAGVHNGVINNHAALNHGGRTYAVDSANLFAALANVRVGEWRNVLRRAQGTLALALVRVRNGSPAVYLTRRGNPLWVAHVAELNALAFASTKDILAGAIKMSRLTGGTFRELAEGALYATCPGTPLAMGARWSSNKKRRPKWVDKSTQGWEGEDNWVTRDRDGHSVATVSTSAGPIKAIGSNGKEYVRCGSCLDWAPPQEMKVGPEGQVLCARCKIAADAWKSSRWTDGSDKRGSKKKGA